MRQFFLWLLITSFCYGQAGSIASRRYNEPAPQGMYFQNPVAVSPYDEANGYTTIPDTQLQWSGTISDDNTFASTSDFTVVRQTDLSTTFSVSGNVGTITTGTASGAIFSVSSNGSGFSMPSNFVETEVNQNGAAANPDQMTLFLTNAGGTSSVGVTVDAFNSTAFLEVNGTQIGSSTSFSLPSAPWYLAISITNPQLSAWVNTGSGWTLLLSSDCTTSTPSYDIESPANLASLKTGLQIYSSSSVTWKFSNLKTSLYGGTGVRDIHLVTYPDGRAYMRGATAYFLATIGGVSGNLSGSTNGIFSFDPTTNTLTLVSSLGISRSSHIYGDQAGNVIYDPSSGTERLTISTWATASGTTVEAVYVSQNIATDDWLSPGPHVTPSVTQLTLPNMTSNNPYDPYLLCQTYDYSSRSCSLWLIAYSAANTGGAYMGSSTSDPSANSWTAVLDATPSNTPLEGSTLIRTASGSTGSTLTGCWSGPRTSATNRTSVCYSQSGALLGSLWAVWPTTTLNIPHNTILKYGNTAYYITFNDNTFASGGGASLGNWIVSSSPRYPAFIYDGGCVNTSGASCTATVNKFDWATVWCRNGSSGVTLSVSSSPANSFTPNPSGSFNVNPTDEIFYSGLLQTGSTSFTCGYSPSGSYQGVAMNLYRMANNTAPVLVNSQIAKGAPSGTSPYLFTSPTFSTNGYGLIVGCADDSTGNSVSGAGNFGGVPAYLRKVSGAIGCADMYFETSQSAITTAWLNTSGSGYFGTGTLIFSANGQTPPSFSPAGGTYAGTQNVTLAASAPGATMCYTTDGTVPTANGAGTCTHGTTYVSAITVSSSETVKAMESVSGKVDSLVRSEAYVINKFTYAGGCANTSSTCSATTTAGEFGVVMCTTASNGTYSVSDSTGSTWVATTKQAYGDYGQVFYTLNVTGSGSTSFSCSGLGSYPGIVVVLYTASATPSLDSGGSPAIPVYVAGAYGSVATSPSFSTTSDGVVVVCGHATGGGVSVGAGSIGGVSATLRKTTGASSPGVACEDVSTPSAQSSITGSMTSSSSGSNWVGAVMAFK